MSGIPPDLRDRIERQQALLQAVRDANGVVPPYHGHMRIQTKAGASDVLLGNVHLVGRGPSIIDWRTAPLAEVFFANAEGDEYELDLGDRVLAGRVLEKNLLSFTSGKLTGLECPRGLARLSAGGGWQVEQGGRPPNVPPRAGRERRPFRSPLEVTLDPEQQAVVDLPDDRSVLVLGEAGFGKTTVALHRLVAMQERSQKRKFKSAVVVPTEGLKRLTELMLARRGVEKVEVFTYDAFASRMARKIFKDLPKRESQVASGGVVRLKRHRALKTVLEAFARRRPRPAKDPSGRERSHALARRADLEHLFGDSAWMDEVMRAAGGAITAGAVRDVLEHTRIQFLDPTERQYAHVTDREALATIDGRSIDEGTPMEDANSVDPEDYAVLFELERLRAAARKEKPAPIPTYDCILVDEAQEFAPLELALLRRCVGPGGTVIVAGDAAQQVDETSDFGGWQQVMEDLGARSHERRTLQINYRCPPDVTALARQLIGVKGALPSVDTPSIVRARRDAPLHLAVWLIEQLRELRSVDPTASIALVARTGPAARALAHVLGYGLNVRLSLQGDFEFRPGVLVTSVEEVKGLEFDYVLLPDVDPLTYADIPEARRALYVALTRATHRLALATPGRWSPLIEAPPRAAAEAQLTLF